CKRRHPPYSHIRDGCPPRALERFLESHGEDPVTAHLDALADAQLLTLDRQVLDTKIGDIAAVSMRSLETGLRLVLSL
ncbi:MAG: hypothetical protein ACR2JK_19325, partial [Geodermatophilaceae bacterium]